MPISVPPVRCPLAPLLRLQPERGQPGPGEQDVDSDLRLAGERSRGTGDRDGPKQQGPAAQEELRHAHERQERGRRLHPGNAQKLQV